jgi:hypothetical protein
VIFFEVYRIGLVVIVGIIALFLSRASEVALEKTLTTTKLSYQEVYVDSTSSFVWWFPCKKVEKE